MAAVEIEKLVKVFSKNIRAVDNVSFQVEEGEIFGLIGPNGAGKTTTLRIISTLLVPTEGRVSVFGHDVTRESGEVRKLIGYLPEEAGAYKNLKGIEFLEFIGRFRAKTGRELEEMLERARKICELGDRLNDKTKTYSKGMLRRLLLAATLMHLPRLGILDEPTSGLDVVNALRVRDIIKDLRRREGMTILLSSHNMLEVEYMCDRVAIIHKGRIVAMGEPEKLKNAYGASNLEEVFVEAIKNGASS